MDTGNQEIGLAGGAELTVSVRIAKSVHTCDGVNDCLIEMCTCVTFGVDYGPAVF